MWQYCVYTNRHSTSEMEKEKIYQMPAYSSLQCYPVSYIPIYFSRIRSQEVYIPRAYPVFFTSANRVQLCQIVFGLLSYHVLQVHGIANLSVQSRPHIVRQDFIHCIRGMELVPPDMIGSIAASHLRCKAHHPTPVRS